MIYLIIDIQNAKKKMQLLLYFKHYYYYYYYYVLSSHITTYPTLLYCKASIESYNVEVSIGCKETVLN